MIDSKTTERKDPMWEFSIYMCVYVCSSYSKFAQILSYAANHSLSGVALGSLQSLVLVQCL